jgi:hypothetical protein
MYTTFAIESQGFYAVRTQSFTVDTVSLVSITVAPEYVPE